MNPVLCELFQRLSTGDGLSSTLASSNATALMTEFSRQLDVYAGRVERANLATRQRSANIEARVIQAVGALPLSLPMHELLEVTRGRMEADWGPVPSDRKICAIIRSLQYRKDQHG